jgi:hypothetical protein
LAPAGRDEKLPSPPYLAFDPHRLHDRYTASYFDNGRNIALINRAYCVANPKHYP